MTSIIQRIRNILTDDATSIISITIPNNNKVLFKIYHNEIPIVVDLLNQETYLDCGLTDAKLTCEQLNELSQICSMLSKNMSEVKEVLN